MSEENNQQANRPAVLINSQYIKDLSLEIPHAPEIFSKISQKPELKVDMNVQSQKLASGDYNVTLNIAINGDVANEKLFIIELSYAAVVSINLPQEHIEPVLAIEIPHLIFPFARNVITQCLTEGGLPPLMLNPIDFVAMYQNRQAAANQAQQDNQTQQA